MKNILFVIILCLCGCTGPGELKGSGVLTMPPAGYTEHCAAEPDSKVCPK